jgi:dTDP-4-amino-4,6-dideoxygalactose transaminase
MLNTPFPPWPAFSAEEADAIRRVLMSNRVNYWTGAEGKELESEFAAFAGTNRAIALANGTVALDLALKALGVGPGDEVVVTPRTFLASASSIVNAGAVPVFADVDLDSQNITPSSVQKVLSPRTKAVMCVHLAGWPCEMDGFLELGSEHNFAIVEDCAQAHGARYRNQPVGSFGIAGRWPDAQFIGADELVEKIRASA